MVLEAYRSYLGERRNLWSYSACGVPHRLAEVFPHLVHVEETSIAQPNWQPEGLKQIFFENNYNWTSNYCVHVWGKMTENGLTPPVPSNPEELAACKSMLGQIMRHALYGYQKNVESNLLKKVNKS
jgi:hypothetical protein